MELMIITQFCAIALCIAIFYIWRRSFKDKRRYPPIVSTGYLVFTTDPRNVEHILQTNFSKYGKGKVLHEQLSDLLGDGIFTVDGDKWKHQRKLASHEFSTKNIREFSSTVFKSNAIKLARMISKSAASNKTDDYQDLFMKSTLDSVFKIVLGVELDTMCGTLEEGTKFSNAFDKASEITSMRVVDVFWKFKKFLNIGSEAKLKINVKLVDDYVYKLINHKIEQVNNSSHDTLSMKKGDILSRFLEVNERDPRYLRDIILSFIIAGKDTTATTLSWFLYMVCKHPDIQERIYNEVRKATKVSDISSFQDIADGINEEALDKLHYLHATITETLRLYPAVPLDPKICLSNDTLPDGFSVKKGDNIAYVPYTMGRMKYIWGDDADEFKPQRWLDENVKFILESSFKFTAFQAGPRICLGKEFAYRQMKIFSAILIGSFEFKLSDEHKVANYITMLTLNMDSGLHLYASQRRNTILHPKDQCLL
ncbi:hypothetical protein ACFE04_004599 [Oxalis oulophora]